MQLVVTLPCLELALDRDLRRTRGVRSLGQSVLLAPPQLVPLKVRLFVELHVFVELTRAWNRNAAGCAYEPDAGSTGSGARDGRDAPWPPVKSSSRMHLRGAWGAGVRAGSSGSGALRRLAIEFASRGMKATVHAGHFKQATRRTTTREVGPNSEDLRIR